MAATLNDKQITQFRQQLKERFFSLREEVRQELIKSDSEHYADMASEVHDIADESVADFLVDLNLANIDRHINEIRAVDAALIRLAEGRYGTCADCGVEIPEQRLKGTPTTSRCLECQKLHEKQYAQPGHASL